MNINISFSLALLVVLWMLRYYSLCVLVFIIAVIAAVILGRCRGLIYWCIYNSDDPREM